MAFRGYMTLNGAELTNSSRVVEHLGGVIPTLDAAVFGSPNDCALVESPDHPGLYELPAECVELRPGLFTPPPGSKMYGRGLVEVDGTCWVEPGACGLTECLSLITYDDTWPGLREWLNAEGDYRVELAPWYSSRIPESGEFVGLWLMDLKGFGPTPVSRTITESVGNGGIAGPHRDTSRTLEFEALLIGCTNAGLEYGLEWLGCQLRRTKDRSDSILRYFNAHPSYTAAGPDDLLRETHGVVLTKSPAVTAQIVTGGKSHQQATVYRVSWEMSVLSPYVYLPQVTIPVVWDTVTTKRVNWLHAADCEQPYTCLDMPVMFSTDCVPEEISVVSTPPPSCGGCMPVCSMLQHSFIVPSRDLPYRCRETAVGIEITNKSASSLSMQAFWRVCGSDVRCENSLFPLQVSGLPPATSLTLDAVTGRYWTNYDSRRWRPIGIVGTPTGAPWRPIVLDRATCWEFVVIAADNTDFDITITLADREP